MILFVVVVLLFKPERVAKRQRQHVAAVALQRVDQGALPRVPDVDEAVAAPRRQQPSIRRRRHTQDLGLPRLPRRDIVTPRRSFAASPRPRLLDGRVGRLRPARQERPYFLARLGVVLQQPVVLAPREAPVPRLAEADRRHGAPVPLEHHGAPRAGLAVKVVEVDACEGALRPRLPLLAQPLVQVVLVRVRRRRALLGHVGPRAPQARLLDRLFPLLRHGRLLEFVVLGGARDGFVVFERRFSCGGLALRPFARLRLALERALLGHGAVAALQCCALVALNVKSRRRSELQRCESLLAPARTSWLGCRECTGLTRSGRGLASGM